jgi:hypothetical protein
LKGRFTSAGNLNSVNEDSELCAPEQNKKGDEINVDFIAPGLKYECIFIL